MGELTSARHEMFCRYYVLEPNGAKAARLAGYSAQGAKGRAWEVLKRKDIQKRLRELRTELTKNYCLNLDTLFMKLETIYRRALEDRKYAAACKAVEIQAKLAGLLPANRMTAHIPEEELEVGSALPSKNDKIKIIKSVN
jgi:phage terminase small subunit